MGGVRQQKETYNQLFTRRQGNKIICKQVQFTCMGDRESFPHRLVRKGLRKDGHKGDCKDLMLASYQTPFEFLAPLLKRSFTSVWYCLFVAQDVN